ncbi:hypothetical protein PIIN_02625 [Serendipita indica DSM 11827]|uniref:DUF676 domain-containing protein n=1 Tax=Serendipita indica (strain DSM 11827) TaxID=1109443 RepID=G4TBP5_SERID|nr:hypothetical protein PIIN_02625 [Serendipita indica DSM 11827]
MGCFSCLCPCWSAPSNENFELRRESLDFLELACPDDAIVAIHGLDGHRERSWTHEKDESQILWLRDLLPSDVPNARILVYGYDANTHDSTCVSTQTIYRHSESFAKALVRIRHAAPRRPLIFVAHSLGGIVLKRTIVMTHITSGTLLYPYMAYSFSELRIAARTVHLALNSNYLDEIQSDYNPVSLQVETVYFYEEYETLIGRKRIHIVPRYSAVIQGDNRARNVGLPGDHINLVKFNGKNDATYTTVLYYIEDLRDTAHKAVAQKWLQEDHLRRGSNLSRQWDQNQVSHPEGPQHNPHTTAAYPPARYDILSYEHSYAAQPNGYHGTHGVFSSPATGSGQNQNNYPYRPRNRHGFQDQPTPPAQSRSNMTSSQLAPNRTATVRSRETTGSKRMYLLALLDTVLTPFGLGTGVLRHIGPSEP